MVTSELTGEVSMGVLLVFLVFWRWGRYIGSDQQGDITTPFIFLFYFYVKKTILRPSETNDIRETSAIVSHCSIGDFVV